MGKDFGVKDLLQVESKNSKHFLPHGFVLRENKWIRFSNLRYYCISPCIALAFVDYHYNKAYHVDKIWL